MRKVHKERLLKLASFLKDLPSKKFDLRLFVDAKEKDNGEILLPKLNSDCGSTACAIGWCPEIFPRSCEYYIRESRFTPDRDYDIFVVSKDLEYKSGDVVEAWGFAQRFFGLSLAEAYYLFSNHNYREGHRGPKSVASRIRDFVKRDGVVNENTRAWRGDYY